MSYDPELFNADPYYDDFSESKKFLRVMFKPGYALQAREVTQLQTILQNQIERFGNHIFENGSVVLDGQVTENILRYGRITGLSGTSSVTDIIGSVVGGVDSAQARIIHAESGLTSSTVDGYNVIFFEYLGGGTGFTSGLALSGTAGTNPISFSLSGNATAPALGEATVVSVDSGVRYVDGWFVMHDAQMIGAYSITGASGSQYRVYSNPSTRIGFVANKSFVTADEDTTLNDPAFGYYNYAAPGADRFKIDLSLSQYNFTPTDVATTSNFAREDFIEFIRIVDGDTVKKELYPAYAAIEDTLARRTYDESGNYTVDSFDLTMTYRGVTGGATGNTLTAELGPGKAYIFGYEFETQGVTPIILPRPRTTKSYTDQVMIGGIGPSILVSPGLATASLTGFNLTNQSLMYLSDGISGATFNNIGTARVRSLRYESPNLYRAYLYDISLTGSFTMSNATRLFVAANAIQGGATGQPAFNIQWQGATGTLSDVVDTGMLFLVPKGDRVEGIDDVNFATSNFVALSLNGSGFGSYTTPNASIDLPYGVPTQLVNPSAEFFVMSVSGAAVGFTAQVETANKFSLTASSAANQTVYVFFTTDIDSPSVRRNKTRVTETFGLTASSVQTDPTTGKKFLYFTGTTGPYNDVVSVVSITGSLSGSSQQVSNLFTLDNGQRDNLYDWSRLLLADNITFSSTAGASNITGPFQVTVTRFTHSGDLGPFMVDSYGGIDYKDIPTYTSPTTGRSYRLSDVLDFRPTRTTNGSLTGQYIVPSETPANDRKIDYTHYLPRTDKIVLNRDRTFKVLTGIPAIDPVAPVDDPDAMTLYSVTMNGYTVDSGDVQIKRVENKRYTMQDIAELENRLDNVEYFTNLSLIEQQAKSSPFLDSDGVEMPKKGILADGFRGHSIGDVQDPMYAASIDFDNGEMRPAFRNRVFRMNSASNPVNVTGSADGIYTLDYTTTPLINQPLATSSITVNPSGVFNYLGFIRSTPSSDFWLDDTNAPIVRINTEGENDSWAYGIASGTGPGQAKGFGSQWNDWESNWSGIERTDYVAPDMTTTNRSIFVTSSGSRLAPPVSRSSILPDSIVDTVGSLQVRRDILPYARSIAVSLSAKNLRPNTYMNLFMDGVSLSTGATSDAAGSLSMSFTVPAVSYTTGKRQIRLTDSATNDLATTTTAADYVLPIEGTWGTFKEGIVSTRAVQTRRESVRSEKIVTNVFGKNLQRSESTKLLGYTDPLSQSFYIDPTIYPSGVFIKKVTLYFKTKDSNTNSPITLTLRPVISGYPHPSKFVPMSDVTVSSSAITTSTTAATGTDFEFTSPIYLPPGEHAFSLTTPSNNFEIYTSEIGQSVIKQVSTEATRRATKQPYARSLFKNQTSTGLQKSDVEDVKFLLHLCSFKNTQPTRTVTVQNAASTYYGSSFDIDVIRYNFPTMTPAGTSLTVKETGIIADSQSTINLNQNITSVKSTPPTVSGGSAFTQLDITLDSDDEFVSPVFDIDRANAYFIENRINSAIISTAGETGASNLSVAEANRTASRFITKRVVLEPGMEATNLRVEMLGSYPAETNFKVYARMSPENGTGLPFDLREYVEMTASTTYANTAVDSFQEMSYSLTGQSPFRVFAVKVVMTSTDGRIVPRFKNLRITAA